jgi:hypothetical protein
MTWTRGSDFSKAFDLIPHDRLLAKISETGVDLRVGLWIKKFFRTFTEQVDGHLSDKVRVTLGMLQGSVLGPLLFLVYVYDIWRDTDSNIQLFTSYTGKYWTVVTLASCTRI